MVTRIIVDDKIKELNEMLSDDMQTNNFIYHKIINNIILLTKTNIFMIVVV